MRQHLEKNTRGPVTLQGGWGCLPMVAMMLVLRAITEIPLPPQANLWVKAKHEGALTLPCIVWKHPRFPHTPGELPNPGIEPRSPALQVDSLPAEPPGKPKNTGMGSLALLQGIFPTQDSNWGLLYYIKAQHEGALPPPCIVRKDPRVPHTARRGA